MKRSQSLVLALLASVACDKAQAPSGFILAVARMQTSSAQITRVAVTVTPANVTTDLTRDPQDSTGSTFAGVLTVPIGNQTVKADAYNGTQLVGSGSAPVLVGKGQQTQVLITILDTTGPDGMLDHSPVVTSLTLPASAVMLGDTLALTAAAIDADNDPLAFSWTTAPAGCGTFSAATAGGACILNARMTRQTLVDNFPVVVLPVP